MSKANPLLSAKMRATSATNPFASATAQTATNNNFAPNSLIGDLFKGENRRNKKASLDRRQDRDDER